MKLSKSTKGKDEEKEKQERRESIKLDEIMRLLFHMSKETLVNMFNALFNETFDPKQVTITKENAKFVNEQLEIIEGDLFLRVFLPGDKRPYLFHIEFQTGEDGTMAIRVLRYDLNKAVENQDLSGDKRILYMPKSLVIHIEEHKDIPNEYHERIVFADGDIKDFTVPVLKYWNLSEDYLVKHNLFPLLPLKIFLLRAELDKLTKKDDEGAKHAAIMKAKNTAEKIAKIALELNKAGRLVNGDYKKVLSAIENLFVHLNNRYHGDEKLNKEVKSMLVQTNFIGFQEAVTEAVEETTKIVEKRKAVEMATKMLLKDKPLEEIIEFTDLTEKEVKEIEI
jgi:predicted transposase/invertase (TIGR01784 family)